jgi:hypothetical protein
MQDTLVTTDRPGLTALVSLVAEAEVSGDLLVSSAKLVDALLDTRSEVDGAVVSVVDDALRACAHRHVVPIDEAVQLVATVTAGQTRSVTTV